MEKELMEVDTGISAVVQKIVHQLHLNGDIKEDLMQEVLIHLWKLQTQGATRSWCVQSCRYRIQNLVRTGRSVDSIKRAAGRVNLQSLDGNQEGDFAPQRMALIYSELFTNDSVAEIVKRLDTGQRHILELLRAGLSARDIARKLNISRMKVRAQRRKIAAVAMKLGIGPRAHRLSKSGFTLGKRPANNSK
jgi:RNA polymerase sigma factor (sigma-70 family)